MAQLLIESDESLSGLRRRYAEALPIYSQEEQVEQEAAQQDQETATRRATAAAYAYVLRETIPILDDVLGHPTMSGNPERERKTLIDESARRLQRLLEEWQSQSLVSDQAYQQSRIAMLGTVLANLEAIQVYH